MKTNSNPVRNQSNNRAELTRLVRAAQGGCRKAFGQLFEQFYQAVYAVTLKFSRNQHTAEELCQDVFVQAMEKLGQLRRPECFGAWLRSIARRMAINQQARRKPCITVPPEILTGELTDVLLPGEVVLQREQAAVVRQGLNELGPLDRQTLTAFYFRHQSLALMSNEFNAPLGTIKRRLHVARKRLAEQINPLVAV